MAQLVAHLLCKQGVTGSSPVSSTISDVLEPLTSEDAGVGARAANGSAIRIVAFRLRISRWRACEPAAQARAASPLIHGREVCHPSSTAVVADHRARVMVAVPISGSALSLG